MPTASSCIGFRNPRFVVTDVSGDPKQLCEDLYGQRGPMDERIKVQQLGLFADRTSCHDLVANQFRVLLSTAAYVLTETLQREGLAGTELQTAQRDTIRLKVLKIGAWIVCSVRRIGVHLAGGYPNHFPGFRKGFRPLLDSGRPETRIDIPALFLYCQVVQIFTPRLLLWIALAGSSIPE